MAKEAQRLLDGSGWLPEPLRLDDVRCPNSCPKMRSRRPRLMKIGRNNLMPPNSITSRDDSRRPALVGAHGAGVQRRPLFY